MTTNSKTSPMMESLSGLETSFPMPDWLLGIRNEAMASCLAAGIPTRREEDWKYTNMLGLDKVEWNFQCNGQGVISKDELSPFDIPSDIRIVMDGGHVREDLSDLKALPPGVTVLPIKDAIAADPIKLRRLLDVESDLNRNVFTDLTRGYLSGGIYIKVEKGTRSNLALNVVALHSQPDSGANVRNILDLGDMAEFTLVQTSSYGEGISTAFHNVIWQCLLGDGSHLRHYRAQDEKVGAFVIDQCWYTLSRDANLEQFTFSAGEGTVRNNLDIRIVGEGATARFNGLYLAGAGLHIDNHSTVDHTVPNSTSGQIYKGILAESGRGVFNGKVFIRKGAIGTNAGQLNKNLLLSNEAEIDTKPELQIDADDVKCSHGAAVGQLNPDEIFYLQTRGIPRRDAVAILSKGFLDELLVDLGHAGFQSRCRAGIDRFLAKDGN